MNTIKNPAIPGHKKIKNIFIGMLVIGSIWGLLDAITVVYIYPLFQCRNLCLCPVTVIIFGFPLMTLAMVSYRKPLMLIGIGVIAALFKLLDFAFVPLPVINGHVIYQPVVNPALAAITASVVFTVFAGILMKNLEKNINVRILTGLFAGFLSTVAFVYAGFYITKTPPLIVDSPFHLLFPLHGPVNAFLGATLLPISYLITTRLQPKIILLQTKRLSLYYLSSVIIIAISLLACTFILIR
jgi:hypothetical protein